MSDGPVLLHLGFPNNFAWHSVYSLGLFHNSNWFHFKYRFGFSLGWNEILFFGYYSDSLSILSGFASCFRLAMFLAFRVAALSGVDPQLTGISFRIVRLRI